MSKTVGAIQTAAYLRLKNVMGAVPVGKMVKPVGATNEYVVVNALPTSMGILQKGYLNVNCHVKDTVDGVSLYPNSIRLDALATLAMSAFEDVTSGGISYFIESTNIEKDEALKEHYANIRIKFNVINT